MQGWAYRECREGANIDKIFGEILKRKWGGRRTLPFLCVRAYVLVYGSEVPRTGFFIEAGSRDGETNSVSLGINNKLREVAIIFASKTDLYKDSSPQPQLIRGIYYPP